MTTFWLVPARPTAKSVASSNSSQGDACAIISPLGSKSETAPAPTNVENALFGDKLEQKPLSPKLQRLVRWNSDVLVRLLKQIVARRNAASEREEPKAPRLYSPSASGSLDLVSRSGTVMDEVKEIIALPEFDAKAAKNQQDPRTVVLDKAVVDQLHNYVSVIASLYREDVPFHNCKCECTLYFRLTSCKVHLSHLYTPALHSILFTCLLVEHASHVTMSVTKMMSRIVAPEEVLSVENDDDNEMQKNLHGTSNVDTY